VIDIVDPINPTITSHADNDSDNNPTTLQGGCETGAIVSISNASLVTNPTTITCTGGTYSVDLTWLPVADGSLETLAVTQTDVAGNPSPGSATVIIDVDLVSPVPSTPTASPVGETTATINWTTDEVTTTQVRYGLTRRLVEVAGLTFS